jgi:hypothetical protein
MSFIWVNYLKHLLEQTRDHTQSGSASVLVATDTGGGYCDLSTVATKVASREIRSPSQHDMNRVSGSQGSASAGGGMGALVGVGLDRKRHDANTPGGSGSY